MRGRWSRKQECATSSFLFCPSSYPPCYLSYKTQLRPPSWPCRPVLDMIAKVPALTYNLGPESPVNCDAKATFKHGDGKSPVTLSKWGPGTIRRSAGGYTAQLPQAFQLAFLGGQSLSESRLLSSGPQGDHCSRLPPHSASS